MYIVLNYLLFLALFAAETVPKKKKKGNVKHFHGFSLSSSLNRFACYFHSSK